MIMGLMQGWLHDDMSLMLVLMLALQGLRAVSEATSTAGPSLATYLRLVLANASWNVCMTH